MRVPDLKTESCLAREVSLRGRCVPSRFHLAKSTYEGRVCALVMTKKPKEKEKKKKKKRKTALIVCRDRKEFWTTQKQFWQWVRDGVIMKRSDHPLTGEFRREHDELMVLVSNTVQIGRAHV